MSGPVHTQFHRERGEYERIHEMSFEERRRRTLGNADGLESNFTPHVLVDFFVFERKLGKLKDALRASFISITEHLTDDDVMSLNAGPASVFRLTQQVQLSASPENIISASQWLKNVSAWSEAVERNMDRQRAVIPCLVADIKKCVSFYVDIFMTSPMVFPEETCQKFDKVFPNSDFLELCKPRCDRKKFVEMSRIGDDFEKYYTDPIFVSR